MKKFYIYAICGLLTSHLCHSAVHNELDGVLNPHRAANRLNSNADKETNSSYGNSVGILPNTKENTLKQPQKAILKASLDELVDKENIVCKAASPEVASLREESDDEKQESDSAPVVVFDGRSIVPVVSSSEKGGRQVISYLGAVVPTPRTFRKIGVDDHVRFLKDQMEETLKKMGVKNVQGISSPASSSSLFYSQKYNITFLMTADLTQFSLFQGWDLTQSAKGDKEKTMVNRFINDLIETISTPCAEVSSVGQLKKYIKPQIIEKAAQDKSLSLFLNVFYKGNQDFFENILDDLDPDSSFKEDLRLKLKNGYKEENADQKIYERLVDKQIFSTLLKERYSRDLQVHIDVYQAILGWQDLHRSLILTCKVGSIGDTTYGEDFCNAFIYPFLDLLLIDSEQIYDSRSSFYNNTVEGLKENEGRFHVVKFKAPSGVVPAIALFGSRKNLSSLEVAAGEGKTKLLMSPDPKPKEKSSCSLM